VFELEHPAIIEPVQTVGRLVGGSERYIGIFADLGVEERGMKQLPMNFRDCSGIHRGSRHLMYISPPPPRPPNAPLVE